MEEAISELNVPSQSYLDEAFQVPFRSKSPPAQNNGQTPSNSKSDLTITHSDPPACQKAKLLEFENQKGREQIVIHVFEQIALLRIYRSFDKLNKQPEQQGASEK